YLHCMRAISHGETYGSHGLPLMGSGDWNDGMNLVGEHGIGESIWLGFFFYTVLNAFAPISEAMSDQAFADHCRLEATTLQTNLEASGWDGNWYRRAYFDDGTALGSATNQECRIDSIAQSWSVLSGAGNPTRSQIAMESLDQHLVRRDHGLIQLLDPPFDTSEMEPGYIKGYVPGVRENGGQYTHAAIWAAMAFAQSGDPTRAWELTEMINPIKHALNPTQVAVYAVEPYVLAADVYGVAPHTGRGGWTWYTGSAGWMYRLIMESLLGLRLEGAGLHFDACLPSDWTDFTVHYRFGETKYTIYLIVQSRGNPEGLIVDGVHIDGKVIPLVDDGKDHKVVLKVFSSALRATSAPPRQGS
ncbi:MAG: cyclic beta 1-2 glucan synthetase, partial [Phycisphaerae bacterium]|nr:cyclic beta 1-2 glucan synthetase [Saprospiraceae bacterium]